VPFWIRHDTGTGQPVIFLPRVPSGAGAGLELLHQCKTVPLPVGYGFYSLQVQSREREEIKEDKGRRVSDACTGHMIPKSHGGLPYSKWRMHVVIDVGML
jgi:hypothetical protein